MKKEMGKASMTFTPSSDTQFTMEKNNFKLGDLVRKKRTGAMYNYERLGVVTRIDGDIIQVFWGGGHGSFLISFQGLELVRRENNK
jgi:hypothetical protein